MWKEVLVVGLMDVTLDVLRVLEEYGK